MRSARIGRSRVISIISVGALLASTSVVLAEIGVVRTGVTGISSPRLYQYAGIGDGPDPIGPGWRIYSPPEPGRLVLNPQGEANGDGPASMISDQASGLILVAWSRSTPSGFDVVISRFDGNDWTTPQVVVGAPGVNELDPQIVVGADGTAHLFYWVDGPSPRVFYTSAPAGLTAWSTPIPVSPPGQVTCRPAGAFFDGVLRVVYEVHEFGYGSAPREVVIARYDEGEFVTEIVAMTSHLGEVRPQVHSHGGKLWVDWIDAETSGHSGELAWTRLNAQGQWEPVAYQQFDDVEQREFLVRGGARMLAIQP